MKTKHAIILIAAGFCADFVSAYYKVTHKPGSEMLFAIATTLKILGTLLLSYKIVTNPKIKDFMNW